MLRPLYDHVVLQREDVGKKTDSGIILTYTMKDSPPIARVIAVGNGRDVRLVVRVNDRVVYKKHATVEVMWNNEEYLILKEEDILAIIE